MSFSPSKFINPVVSSMPPSGIRKLFDIAQNMEDVISLGIGEPDFITPWHIRNAGIASLESGKTQYSSNAGVPELKTEISNYMKRRFNITYDAKNQVIVTVGGSEAIDLCVRALVCPGDEVIVPVPSFVCYGPIVSLAGGTPVYVNLRAEDNFRLTPELLKAVITQKTKLLILPFPNNPTGSIMEKSDLEAIAEVIRNTDIMILSDEIYAELNYSDSRHISIAEIDGMYDRTVVVSGFSKCYAMTGWRLGYACGHPDIIKPMLKIHQYAVMCAPTTSQYAAIEALRNGDDDIAAMRKEYNYRRKLIVNGFNKLGMDCFEPLGAFYCFPSVKNAAKRLSEKYGCNCITSEDVANLILEKAHVALVPGTAFGECGEGFLRVSYAYSTDHIKKALERIAKVLD